VAPTRGRPKSKAKVGDAVQWSLFTTMGKHYLRG
jgi:hypothetical protein